MEISVVISGHEGEGASLMPGLLCHVFDEGSDNSRWSVGGFVSQRLAEFNDRHGRWLWLPWITPRDGGFSCCAELSERDDVSHECFLGQLLAACGGQQRNRRVEQSYVIILDAPIRQFAG